MTPLADRVHLRRRTPRAARAVSWWLWASSRLVPRRSSWVGFVRGLIGGWSCRVLRRIGGWRGRQLRGRRRSRRRGRRRRSGCPRRAGGLAAGDDVAHRALGLAGGAGEADAHPAAELRRQPERPRPARAGWRRSSRPRRSGRSDVALGASPVENAGGLKYSTRSRGSRRRTPPGTSSISAGRAAGPGVDVAVVRDQPRELARREVAARRSRGTAGARRCRCGRRIRELRRRRSGGRRRWA